MENRLVAIITGASRGIGQATALKFAEQGYFITIVSNEVEELKQVYEQVRDLYPVELLACAGDLADSNFVKSIVTQTLEKWGRIDAVVNNAAWRTIQSMRTMDVETWEKTFQVCLTAPAFLAKWSAQAMEERKIAGVIINISSIMAGRVAGNSPAYTAAKGALETLTKELAITYGRSGIRVVGISPGNIDTTLSQDYETESGDNISAALSDAIIDATPLGRAGYPAEIANAIYWLGSDQASFISGCTLPVDGGFLQNFNSYSLKRLQFKTEF